MIIGILSAGLDVTLEEAMTQLMEIGSSPAMQSETDGSNVPQVHALNSLTAIFKTSYLSHSERKLEAYIPHCLQLAADCLKSEVCVISSRPSGSSFTVLTIILVGPSETVACCSYEAYWIACLVRAKARP